MQIRIPRQQRIWLITLPDTRIFEQAPSRRLVARGFFATHFAVTDRDHRQLLVRQAIGLHVTQYGDREQSGRPHWPIGLLEPAGEARRRHDIAGASDAGAAALAMRDQYRLAKARGDRRSGVADMDHKRAAARPRCRRPILGVMPGYRIGRQLTAERVLARQFGGRFEFCMAK
jgi:hypothetical protein